MKKSLFILLFVFSFLTSYNLLAQAPPPPPGPGPEGDGSNPVGGSAPIGSGLAILLSLAGAYGGYKLYKSNKKQDEEE